jgi:hypothetical protein
LPRNLILLNHRYSREDLRKKKAKVFNCLPEKFSYESFIGPLNFPIPVLLNYQIELNNRQVVF